MHKKKNIVINDSLANPPEQAQANWFSDWENRLLSLGYQRDALPLADLLKHYHQLSGHWVIASPVYIHTSHNDALITQSGPSLHFSEQDSETLFNRLKPFLMEEGIELIYHDATTWLARLDSPAELNSPPPAYLHHQSLMPYLEKMGPDMSWQKRFTEIQMAIESWSFGSTQPWPVNAVWFWQGGKLGACSDRIITDDKRWAQFESYFPNLSIAETIGPAELDRAQHLFLMSGQTGQMLIEHANNYTCDWYWHNAYYQQKRPGLWQRLRSAWF